MGMLGAYGDVGGTQGCWGDMGDTGLWEHTGTGDVLAGTDGNGDTRTWGHGTMGTWQYGDMGDMGDMGPQVLAHMRTGR